jgi:hypothetical protein
MVESSAIFANSTGQDLGMPDARPAVSSRTMIGLIMGGLVVWAIFLAIGAYRYNFNPWRGVLVLGSMALFLSFWLLMLRSQGPQAPGG